MRRYRRDREPTPFFVYGTLRPGGHLARYWERLADPQFDGNATVRGFRLVASPFASFPYALPAADNRQEVVGTLLAPRSGADADVLMGLLDELEGHPHHYVRRVVEARLPIIFGDTEAWMYIASHETEARLNQHGAIPVPGNDWQRMVRA